MRSWRRGMREMDLLLGPFAEAELATMDGPTLDIYARMLEENDQDLYAWIIAKSRGETGCPAPYAGLIARISAAASDRIGKN
ncbi:succinate dehydrogenase assembly factor 2 [Paracoccus sp. S-4012]|nr:succinate dehydrogenase assembly factor 2 [Paracoccus sp. S-4012]